MMDETRSGERGFTLIELLIAMMVSGLILAAASTGFITTARGMVGLHDRFVQSHDAQLLAAYFPSDVQSANPNLGIETFDTNSGAWAVCAGPAPADDNMLQLQWAETTGVVATQFAVSYRIREVPRPPPAPSDWQLVRYFCSGTTVNSDVVAHNLAEQVGTTSPPLPKVEFAGRKLTLTLFSAPSTVGDYSYTFSGQMRTPIPPPPYPVVSFINRKTPSPTNAPTTVAWKVVFDRAVTGVDDSDFAIVATNLSGVGPPVVVPVSQAEYTVTVDTGTGSGAISLSLTDHDNSIVDTTAAQNALGGPAPQDGDFDGQPYEIDRTPPTVSSINLAGLDPTSGPNVSWTVTLSEDVSGVNDGDFALAASGVSGGAISVTAVSATVYTVTAGPVSGSGTLGLNLVDNDSVKDTVLNSLAGASTADGDFTGQVYTINGAAPAAPSITDVQLLNKVGNPSTAGKIEKGGGDSVAITFSAIMKVSTLCSTWAGDGNDQSLTAANDVTVRVTENGSNDTLSVTSASCTFNFESIDLAGNYVNNTVSFGGSGSNASSITWKASTHVLTVILGGGSGANSDYNAVTSSQPVYTASPSTTNPTGQAVDNSPYDLSAAKYF